MKLAALLFTTLCVGAQLSIYPPAIQLSGAGATQTFIVSYTDDAGYEHDVTSECASSNTAKTSMKAVVVKCRGLQASAPVIVKIAARTPGISFVNDVSPIFTMSGCAGARTATVRFADSADSSCRYLATSPSRITKPLWAAIDVA